MDDWPFADPKNVIALTVRQITDGCQPILYVSHDEEDGVWQFHTGGPALEKDAMVVILNEIYVIDPSIGELADLPLGWFAERSAIGEKWQRQAKD